MRNNNNKITTITTSITEQKKIEFKNSLTKKSINNDKMTTTQQVSTKKKHTSDEINGFITNFVEKNRKRLTKKTETISIGKHLVPVGTKPIQTFTIKDPKLISVVKALTKKQTDDKIININVTTISNEHLMVYKKASQMIPLNMPQIMNYPHLHSNHKWICVPDETTKGFYEKLNKFPINKRDRFKDIIISTTGQHSKIIWNEEEERFMSWQDGEWWFICDTNEFCYNISVLEIKDWGIKQKYFKLIRDYMTLGDEVLSNNIVNKIVLNRTGNADGKARKVKNTKKTIMYQS